MTTFYFILPGWLTEANADAIEIYTVDALLVAANDISQSKVKSILWSDIETALKANNENYRFIAVLPSELTNTYKISLPAKKRTDVINMIPFALEDEIAEKIADVHWVATYWRPKSHVNVATINKANFIKTIEWFKTKGVALDDIIPDYKLLPMHAQATHSIAVVGDEESDNNIAIEKSFEEKFSRILIYSAKHKDGFAISPAMFALWWQSIKSNNYSFAVNNQALAQYFLEQNLIDHNVINEDVVNSHVSYWDFGNDIEHWLSTKNNNADAIEPFFFQDEFAKRSKQNKTEQNYVVKSFAIFATALTAYFVISLANYGYHFYLLKQSENKISQAFDSAFPDATFDLNKNEFLQIREQIPIQQNPSLFIDLMNKLSPILGQHGQILDSLYFDGNSLFASTTVDSFDALNAVVVSFKAEYSNTLISIDTSESVVDNSENGQAGQVKGSYKITASN